MLAYGDFMAKGNVAVLDIRSSEVTSAVGARGVNGTFIIKSKFTSEYEGFAEGELIDVENFCSAIKEAVKNTLSSVEGKIKTFYVGIPGEFFKVINTDNTVSFSSSKTINRSDISSLVSLSCPQNLNGYSVFSYGTQYYVLSDKRRTVNPIGSASDSLRGKLCFYLCKNSFVQCVEKAFEGFKKIKIEFVPSCHAQAMYLLSPEKRDEYAVLFDFGFISSTYSIVCGNGIAYSESFSVGMGHLAVYLMSELDVPYEVALELIKQVNLNCLDRANQIVDYRYGNNLYSFSASLLREKMRECLDGVCEIIEECRHNYAGVNVSGKLVYITGECVNTLRGAVQHISDRLGKNVEVIAPALPYYDKPQFSSLFSLLNFAINAE